jgi:cytochrome P450
VTKRSVLITRSYIIENNKGEITNRELEQSGGTLIVAGSETSATLLSGALYYLLKNMQWMTKLHQELQDNFQSDSDITFASLSRLEILNAIIKETFRIYPVVPTALPRIVTGGGATVCGYVLPPGTRVGVPQYSMNRSSQHFTNPDIYAPERFLRAKEYANDRLDVIQPFSVGPRNCIGKSLAWAEIRTILARLVWNFQFEMVDKNRDWGRQKEFILWDKPSLMVRLTARNAVA